MTRITTLSVAFLLFATIISLVVLLTGHTAAKADAPLHVPTIQTESSGVWTR